MKTRASDILSRKGHEVLTVETKTTVYDAIKSMAANKVGSVLVVDGETLCGIFTERDYMHRIVLEGRTSKATPVEQVMTRGVMVIEPTTGVDECMQIMTQERCRHLPVVESDGRLVGLVSIGDCVLQLTDDARAEIRYLQDYITGSYPC